MLLYGFMIDWHLVSVDVGALRYFAMRLEWNNLSTYHNGFYPALPVMLVKLAGPDNWHITGLILSNLLYGLSLGLSYQVLHKLLSHRAIALLATSVLAILPGFIAVFVSPMQDSLLVALFIMAIWALLVEEKFWLSGLLLGLMAATRYHGLLLAILFLVLFIFTSGASWKLKGKAALMMLLGMSPQVFISLTATGSPFDNDQLYNVFKTFYRSEIDDAALIELPKSIFGIMAHNPGQFWLTYLNILLSNTLYIIVPALALVKYYRSESWIWKTALLLIVYISLSALGGSVRMYAPIGLFIVLVFAHLFKKFDFERFKHLRLVILIGLLHFLIIENILTISVHRQNSRINDRIKTVLKEQNPAVTRSQIFSSFYDYTWQDIPGLIGYGTKRAWLRHADPWFAENFPGPDLNKGSKELWAYCEANKIRYLILNKAKMGASLHAEIRNSTDFIPLVKMDITKPRMTFSYQIHSKKFDEVYLYELSD